MFNFASDLEIVVIIIVLIALFFMGMTHIEHKEADRWSIDKNYSSLLKALGCVFVLIGHYEANVHLNSGDMTKFGGIIYCTTANIGLVWFMFISGYGLSVSHNSNRIVPQTVNRLQKVYLPLLFVSVLALCLYAILPVPDEAYLDRYTVSRLLVIMHNIASQNICDVITWGIGLVDWYVMCIMMFYTLFYIARYMSCTIDVLRSAQGETIALSFLLLLYYIIAFQIAGYENAHYYRLTWAFLFGHLLARYKSISRTLLIICIVCGFATFCFEYYTMIFSFVVAILGLYICIKLNYTKTYCKGPLLFLGTISYFFYLTHERISWVILNLMGNHDIIIWIIITIIVSVLSKKLYDYISCNLKIG